MSYFFTYLFIIMYFVSVQIKTIIFPLRILDSEKLDEYIIYTMMCDCIFILVSASTAITF